MVGRRESISGKRKKGYNQNSDDYTWYLMNGTYDGKSYFKLYNKSLNGYLFCGKA